jgi:hypothetical protein
MGKAFLLGLALTVGYFIGYRDARNHSEHIVARAVVQVREFFGGSQNRNDIDAVMTKVEGKN